MGIRDWFRHRRDGDNWVPPGERTTYSQRFEESFAQKWQDDRVLRASDPYTYKKVEKYY
jgi:hypothetical protein